MSSVTLQVGNHSFGKINRTRFDLLGYWQVDPLTWMFVSLENPGKPAQVGAQYASKAELLSDLDRYARECWGL